LNPKSNLFQIKDNKEDWLRIYGAPLSSNADISAVVRILEVMVDNERLLHSLGTYHTMLLLARHYGEDLRIAGLTGLLHDCARSAPEEGELSILDVGETPLSAEDMAFPKIWHARLGAVLLKTVFGIENEEIAEAIRVHPTGAPAMSRLARLLYIADYIEPTRSFEDSSLGALRVLAFSDMEVSFRTILKHKLGELQRREKSLHPDTLRAHAFYIRED
jgi:predicted HD superfamily hydrolase involved in NAD metabolism